MIQPLIARLVVVAAMVTLVALPAWMHRGRPSLAVVTSRKGPLERLVLAGMGLGALLPTLWALTPWLRFADVPLHPLPFLAGLVALGAGLLLLGASHARLGRYWSSTLELRDGHALVTDGVYRRVRHPMYLALLLHAAGLALVVPNLLAGPSYLVAVLALIRVRVPAEERMMAEAFGSDYEDYRRRTRRLIPGLW